MWSDENGMVGPAIRRLVSNLAIARLILCTSVALFCPPTPSLAICVFVGLLRSEVVVL